MYEFHCQESDFGSSQALFRPTVSANTSLHTAAKFLNTHPPAKVYSISHAVYKRAHEQHILQAYPSIFKLPEQKEKVYLMTHRHMLPILECHVLDLSAVLC